ncbi:hypothetical protein BD410DRAFT_841811 [Rickenella mellea]|uniref:MARVEL domain-containing protein n=1 Tax=Rickenella mellea TaxID=50990 RepID=A0A4Y7PXX4_9AGAM|nr:hypothetical protein BD410DRAFT_841811 [Rickenella mellea]
MRSQYNATKGGLTFAILIIQTLTPQRNHSEFNTMPYFYSTLRTPLYGFLWVTSLVLLGLTAYRIHFTRSSLHYYDKIIAALLATAIFTMLWVPVAMSMVIRTNRNRSRLRHEMGPLFVLWVMWLVESAIATNKWPARRFICGAFTNKQCNILTAIIALSWIAFSLTSLIMVLALMHGAANDTTGAPAAGGYGRHGENKAALGTTAAAGAGTGYAAGHHHHGAGVNNAATGPGTGAAVV